MNNDYTSKTDDQLAFILKDAREALDCAKSLGDAKGEAKYADQINDAATEVYRRKQAAQKAAKAAKRGAPVELTAYEARVRELEAEGLTRSDAQGVADAEEMAGNL